MLREGQNKVGEIFVKLTAEELARCTDHAERVLVVLTKIHSKDYMLVVDDVTAVVNAEAGA